MKYLFSFTFFGFAFVTNVAHAESSNEGMMTKILANQEYCVHACVENKVYLNPERVHVQDGRFYIDLNDQEGIVVAYLNFDRMGEYISSNEIAYYYCPQGHLTPRKDKKCLVAECPYYCGNPNG